MSVMGLNKKGPYVDVDVWVKKLEIGNKPSNNVFYFLLIVQTPLEAISMRNCRASLVHQFSPDLQSHCPYLENVTKNSAGK